MANTYLQGAVTAFGIQTPEVINDISAYAVSMFVPETPLLSLLPREPVGTVAFEWLNSKTRPRANTVGTGGMTDTTGTSLPVADASMYMTGDILEIGTERLEVTGDPVLTTTPNTVAVRRAAQGSTAATHAATTAITLIGNSRPDAVINPTAIRNIRVKSTNYCQNFIFPVQVGGVAASTRMVLPPGVSSLFTSDQLEALRNMMRDIENTAYYGIAEAQSGTVSPKTAGLKAQIVTNKTTASSDAAAYTVDSFIRDGVQKCRDGGGDPNFALVSTGFLRGLAKWGQTPERITVGETRLGTPIEAYKAPFLSREIVFMEAQQLGSASNITYILLNSDEVKMRVKRNEFWNPHGVRGDLAEGEYIAEMGLQLINEAHHAYVDGITAFA